MMSTFISFIFLLSSHCFCQLISEYPNRNEIFVFGSHNSIRAPTHIRLFYLSCNSIDLLNRHHFVFSFGSLFSLLILNGSDAYAYILIFFYSQFSSKKILLFLLLLEPVQLDFQIYWDLSFYSVVIWFPSFPRCHQSMLQQDIQTSTEKNICMIQIINNQISYSMKTRIFLFNPFYCYIYQNVTSSIVLWLISNNLRRKKGSRSTNYCKIIIRLRCSMNE